MASDVDLIISWPNSMDYPLWRDFIVEHLAYFNQVFIVFTETNTGIDYSEFVTSSLSEHEQIVCMKSRKLENGEDWRSVAVNQALDQSKSKWVWFTEQDFFVLSPSFWPITKTYLQKYDVVGYKDGATRMHPCNLWVKREYIDKTGKDFGVVPDKLDHFARFYNQLRESGAFFKQLKYDPAESIFYHMNGLSSNLSLIQRGEVPNYKDDEFNAYLTMTLDAKNLDPRYKKMCEEYLNERI
jgi:hypothetical protein